MSLTSRDEALLTGDEASSSTGDEALSLTGDKMLLMHDEAWSAWDEDIAERQDSLETVFFGRAIENF